MKVQCKKCGGEIESRHRHDFVSCSCGAIAIDGGTDYTRLIGNPADFVEYPMKQPKRTGVLTYADGIPAVSLPPPADGTELRYALTRLQVCVADADGLANYPPALLRDDVRLMLVEARAARQHDADQRATIATLEGELKTAEADAAGLRQAIERAIAACPFCQMNRCRSEAHEWLRAAIIARATPAGEGRE